MPLFPGRLFAKVGAEGVYCGALPDLGLGVALKIDDGTTRAAEVAMAAVVDAFLVGPGAAPPGFDALAAPTLRNRRDIAVGVVRPSAGLATTLRQH
jgi:L-asparaginase II